MEVSFNSTFGGDLDDDLYSAADLVEKEYLQESVSPLGSREAAGTRGNQVSSAAVRIPSTRASGLAKRRSITMISKKSPANHTPRRSPRRKVRRNSHARSVAVSRSSRQPRNGSDANSSLIVSPIEDVIGSSQVAKAADNGLVLTLKGQPSPLQKSTPCDSAQPSLRPTRSQCGRPAPHTSFFQSVLSPGEEDCPASQDENTEPRQSRKVNANKSRRTSNVGRLQKEATLSNVNHTNLRQSMSKKPVKERTGTPLDQVNNGNINQQQPDWDRNTELPATEKEAGRTNKTKPAPSTAVQSNSHQNVVSQGESDTGISLGTTYGLS